MDYYSLGNSKMVDTINYHGTPEEFEREIHNAYRKAMDTGVATQRDIELISEFVEEAYSNGKICPSRRKKIVYLLLGNLKFYSKEYELASTSDIREAAGKIRNAKKPSGKPLYTQNTQHDHITLLKRFTFWIIDSEYSKADPPINIRKINEIKTPTTKRDTVRPDEIPTEDECKRILRHAGNSRNRCMFSFMMDGGLRSQEVASLKFGDMIPSLYSIKALIRSENSKTENPRIVPLFSSSDYYSEWLAERKGPQTPDDYIFTRLDKVGVPLAYHAVRKCLQKAVKSAGITRRIHMHLFRHYYVTTSLESGMQQNSVSMVAWGIPNSSSLATYAHLRIDKIEEEGARARGIEVQTTRKKREGNGLRPIQCPYCGTFNETHRTHCKTCLQPLTQDTISTQEALKKQLSDALLHNPALLQALQEFCKSNPPQ